MALEVILRSIFGLDYDDYEAIGCHFNLVSEEPARDFAFAQAFRGLRKLILQVVDRRRREPATAHGDFLSLLMHMRDPHDGESMQDRQIANEVLTLIVAGHETTASTLNWTWYLLSQHPEVETQLDRDLVHLTGLPDLDDLTRFPYSSQIIDESMRLYPPGWLLTRKALHDDHLGDYFVPAGTEVYIAPYFIQRHPAIWPNLLGCFGDPGHCALRSIAPTIGIGNDDPIFFRTPKLHRRAPCPSRDAASPLDHRPPDAPPLSNT